MHYNIRLQVLPLGDRDAAEYRSASRGLLDAFTARFGPQGIAIIRAGDIAGAEQPWVSHVLARAESKAVALEAVRWAAESADRTVLRFTSGIAADASPQSVVSARWVPLVVNWPHAEAKAKSASTGSMNEWPIACDVCRVRDVQRPPRPYVLSDVLAAAPKHDIFMGNNGLLAVREAACALLLEYAGGDVEEVPCRGPDGLRVLRVTRCIGDLVNTAHDKPCSACGVPTQVYAPDVTLSGRIVSGLGDAGWNLAKVGAHVRRGIDIADRHAPYPHPLAISGGLYAVLYNAKVGGLAWPDDGPYVLVQPDEATWESGRRFSDAYVGAADRIMKKKVTAP